jgi:hypothetical protein
MINLFAAFTPVAYSGATASVIFLGLCGVLTIVPGLIHSFVPDGGAETIAGLRLGDQRELVIGTFAWAGATQIVWGLAMLAVALKYRMLVPLFLVLILLERSLLVGRWWLWHPAAVAHHPPEHYASLAMLPLLVLFLVLALRNSA